MILKRSFTKVPQTKITLHMQNHACQITQNLCFETQNRKNSPDRRPPMYFMQNTPKHKGQNINLNQPQDLPDIHKNHKSQTSHPRNHKINQHPRKKKKTQTKTQKSQKSPPKKYQKSFTKETARIGMHLVKDAPRWGVSFCFFLGG